MNLLTEKERKIKTQSFLELMLLGSLAAPCLFSFYLLISSIVQIKFINPYTKDKNYGFYIYTIVFHLIIEIDIKVLDKKTNKKNNIT